MHPSMGAHDKQLTASISKSNLSTHCIAIAKMVANRALILNFLQLHLVISILNHAHEDLL